MSTELAALRTKLQRVETTLFDVRAQKNRLQYEMDAIHQKNGTYRIICHLRNEIQRLTVSKLLLIQSTAYEMNRLRKIISTLSNKQSWNDKQNLLKQQQNEKEKDFSINILNDLLPSPTPSEPPNFSWKDTYQIDLNEDDIDNDIQSNTDNNNNNDNIQELEKEDDIKIPEMNPFDDNDGDIRPFGAIADNNIDDDDIDDDNNDDDDDSDDNSDDDNDNDDDDDDDDDDDYVIERVASPELSVNDDDDDDNDDDDNMIAMAHKKALFSDADVTHSNNVYNNNNSVNNDGDLDIYIPHHLHDDSCNHSDASPQLQFAGDGDDLNRVHGISTDAPILPPSTDGHGDIYGEQDHKMNIVVINDINNNKNASSSSSNDNIDVHVDDEKALNERHAQISPKISAKVSIDKLLSVAPVNNNHNGNNNNNNGNDDMDHLDLISEIGDDDNDDNTTPSPSIAVPDNKNDDNKDKNDDKNNDDDPQLNITPVDPSVPSPITPSTPDQIYINNDDLDDLDINNDDDCDSEAYDEFEYSLSASMLVKAGTPPSRRIKLHGYDVSTEFNLTNILNTINNSNPNFKDDDNKLDDINVVNGENFVNKPRRPLPPQIIPSTRVRSASLSDQNVSLLNGLRLGEMDVHIDICRITELIEYLSIICRSLVLLPFGLNVFRNKLLYVLLNRMSSNYQLSQHFTFVLNAYRDCFAVSRVFRDNICMESIIELQRLNTIILQQNNGVTAYTPSVNNVDVDVHDDNVDDDYKIVDSHENIEYSGSNVIEFFRLPLIYPYLSQEIYATKCKEFVCPITGISNVERLVIRKVFNSNAKPLLIDCYLRDKYTPISSFILKYGDDLRRDAAVLMMFKFMNTLWIDNNCVYNGKQILALTYKCYPCGPDYGIIELIPNCNTLKDITDKYVNNRNNKLNDNVISQLIATGAGSFMAAYIMGIRDRHYDNVLITDDGTIFHIDFGYMLGEKVSGLDTAKFAITSDLAKLMGKRYKEFIEISVKCWKILRENHQELLDFAKLSFSFLYSQEIVQEFIKNTLLFDINDIDNAGNKIRKKLQNAPKKFKTKMKNFVHSVASSRNRSSSGADLSKKSKSKRISKSIKSKKPSHNKKGSGLFGILRAQKQSSGS